MSILQGETSNVNPDSGDNQQKSGNVNIMDFLQQMQNNLKTDMTNNMTLINTNMTDIKTGQDNLKTDMNTIKTEITQILENMDRKIQEFRHEFEEAHNRHQQELIEERNKDKEELKNEIKNRIEDTRKEITTELEKRVEPIREKIIEMEKLKRMTTTYTCHANRNLMDIDLKFYGDNRMNPIVYLKQLKDKMLMIGEDVDFKSIIRSTLRGTAEIWFEITEDDIDTMDDFVDSFLTRFWGEMQQSNIRQALYFGKFDESYGVTRENYAMKKIAKTKYLEPPIAERDMVKYIARHFPEQISEVIAIQDIKTKEKFLEYLRRVDDIKKIKRKPYNSNPQYGRDGGRTEQNTNLGRNNNKF